MLSNTTFNLHPFCTSRVLFRSRSQLKPRLKLAIGCRA
jgi:hypothetical protein